MGAAALSKPSVNRDSQPVASVPGLKVSPRLSAAGIDQDTVLPHLDAAFNLDAGIAVRR
jgi:hypothetical protein